MRAETGDGLTRDVKKKEKKGKKREEKRAKSKTGKNARGGKEKKESESDKLNFRYACLIISHGATV